MAASFNPGASALMQPPSTSIPQPSASLMTQHPPPTTTESPSTMQSPCPALSSTSRRPLHRLSCEICEHCQSPLCRDERMVMRDGYSYHKKCHKCYVCSETDLVNAEVFKGVIFCSGCAQRIFQGCFTARRIKTSRGSRGRKTRSKSKRRDRVRPHVKRQDGSRDGVIELARLHGSVSTLSIDVKEKQTKKTSKAAMTIPSLYGERGERKIYEEGKIQVQGNVFKKEKIKRNQSFYVLEMGTTTDVTQELLRQINCAVPDCEVCILFCFHTHWQALRMTAFRALQRANRPPQTGPYRADVQPGLRELGVSTEIANMALRKNSEVPVIIKSKMGAAGEVGAGKGGFKIEKSYLLQSVGFESRVRCLRRSFRLGWNALQYCRRVGGYVVESEGYIRQLTEEERHTNLDDGCSVMSVFMCLVNKRAYGLPDGMQSAPPMDIHNTGFRPFGHQYSGDFEIGELWREGKDWAFAG
ncbi:unnamed protein product [Spodoptera exigua]|nr:unnamed protein product [Spodoptera exigua]